MLIDEVGKLDYTGDRAYRKGRTFRKVLTFDGAYWGNMTEAVFEASIKKYLTDEAGTDFICTFDTVTNELTMELPNATADLLPNGHYALDIKLIIAPDSTQVAEGQLEIKGTVTP